MNLRNLILEQSTRCSFKQCAFRPLAATLQALSQLGLLPDKKILPYSGSESLGKKTSARGPTAAASSIESGCEAHRRSLPTPFAVPLAYTSPKLPHMRSAWVLQLGNQSGNPVPECIRPFPGREAVIFPMGFLSTPSMRLSPRSEHHACPQNNVGVRAEFSSPHDCASLRAEGLKCLVRNHRYGDRT